MALKTIPAISRGENPARGRFALSISSRRIFMLMIDESHATIPQIGGMSNGDRPGRRISLTLDSGFRQHWIIGRKTFAEFEQITGQTLYVSATPAEFELKAVGRRGRTIGPTDGTPGSRDYSSTNEGAG
jgi:excinuclease UvrABC helicase subunit UvrB